MLILHHIRGRGYVRHIAFAIEEAEERGLLSLHQPHIAVASSPLRRRKYCRSLHLRWRLSGAFAFEFYYIYFSRYFRYRFTKDMRGR